MDLQKKKWEDPQEVFGPGAAYSCAAFDFMTKMFLKINSIFVFTAKIDKNIATPVH